MIPSVLTRQLRQGVEDFLHTTFPITTPFFHGLLERLLRTEGGVFKGPYLSIQLPFRRGQGGVDYFPDVPLKFAPYLHQERAFERLRGPHYRSTLVATGTGSGKTESFLYPILDHCHRHRDEPGIKAIIIYPMNALATDQAGRLAGMVFNNPRLRGRIRAGLFVGQSEQDPAMAMGPANVISHKDTQRLDPPDVLLTNYKMLDYLLVRPRDFPLWRHNGPETLRYLVVDELHTFDGAQGTDLACLIRRLKVRLKTPAHFLCGVGTSATLGSLDEAARLRDYAQAVFGEPFDADAVIGESRLRPGEFLEGLISRVDVAPSAEAERLAPEAYPDYPAYVRAQHALWFGDPVPEDFDAGAWRVALGERLHGHLVFHNLLKVLKKLGDRPATYRTVLAELEQVTPGLKNADPEYRTNLLNSLLALVSEARTWAPETPGDRARREAESDPRPTTPFLQIRLQFWLRELRRMLCSVSGEPRLAFADDLTEAQLKTHLPVVHCRECGSMGWAGLRRRDGLEIRTELQDFYIAFFNSDPQATFLFPADAGRRGLDGHNARLCSACLRLTMGVESECPACGGDALIAVFIPDNRGRRNDRVIGTHHCPYCGAHDSLTLLGSRAASLTSVLIAQLYASGFNDDKKLLTFSDSVQDAAHRAGFFAARTWTFNLRTALQRFLLDRGDGLSLAELPEAFTRYWSAQMDQASYITTFLAPSMAWFQDYDHLRQHGELPPGSTLRRDVDRRLGWEIYSEYGFSARIGRTLEKTASSIAHPDSECLKEAVEGLLEPLRNEIGALRALDPATLRRFLLGLLTHLRTQGAVLHPVLKGYLENRGNTYLLSRIPWMPRFGPATRAPAFLIDRHGVERFDALLGGRAWYQSWAEKCFGPLSPLISAETDRLYELALKRLCEIGMLEERRVQNSRVWGIRPEALRVSARVGRFRCERCGHAVSGEAGEARDWQGMPCLRFFCIGQYQAQPPAPDYYGKLYASGNVERVHAFEHTGLLERDERQKLEQDFKARPPERKPWYPNLLSCTPTLEMGIDIGDLSSVILCSVPPGQASYLQRIGRAGRRDGNALGVTVANGRPHDLYFFAEPLEMLAGRVETPGVFLDASAVLERQLTAFCFDRWVETGIPETALPQRLGHVFGSLASADEGKFPHRFLRFVETYQTALFDGFVAMFEPALSETSIEHLRDFMAGDGEDTGGLRWRIVHALHDLKKGRDSLSAKVRTLTDRIRRKEQDPARGRNHQEELDELRREKSALQALVAHINRRETLNFFTDEGLLPNYAFPEAGVILHSLIYRRRDQAGIDQAQEDDTRRGERRYDTWHYEYERPATSAIGELAPDNVFYAGGRRVRVDQVDMTMSEAEDWRFCNNCAHMELEALGTGATACPACGSALWSDGGQKRRMLRMRQVFATTADRDSRIGDQTDDREPGFYNKQMLVDFEKPHVTDAWRVDDDELPFGFEFLSRAVFREINFGEKGEYGDRVTIAGVELPRKGFSVCRHCGKVQAARGEPRHALSCTARDRENPENLIDCLYLYRELASEAIRILLPVTTFGGAAGRLHSFVAALQLGLKITFAGRVDHLRTAVYEEPVPESGYRKQYLMLYDTVPGGTGYLKQLMRSPEPLMTVLQAALDRLRACSCNQDPGKDGCYRCLFAYRNSYDMAATSRDTAMELLADILARRDRLVRIGSLSQVPVNTLFDSELEARFIEALRRARHDDLPVSLDKQVVGGKPGYFLRIGGQAWYVEPQAELNAAHGVTVPSRADFLIRPARERENRLPVAVFTDGYLFHRNRVGRDMAQRMAIALSGRYHVWSLSWKDVENRFRGQGGYFADPFPADNRLPPFLRHYNADALRPALREDSFAWLIRFLAAPDRRLWQRCAFVQGLVHVDGRRFTAADDRASWSAALRETLPEAMGAFVDATPDPRLHGLIEPDDRLRLLVTAEQDAVPAGRAGGLRLACALRDDPEARAGPGFEALWNGFLRLYNLFQFLPYAFFITTQGMAEHAYEDLAIEQKPAEPPEPYSPEDAGWAEVFGLTDVEVHSLLKRLSGKGWPAPEAGFELTGDQGEVIASAELGWEALRIAFLREDELEYRTVFEAAGWRAYPLSEALANPDACLDLYP